MCLHRQWEEAVRSVPDHPKEAVVVAEVEEHPYHRPYRVGEEEAVAAEGELLSHGRAWKEEAAALPLDLGEEGEQAVVGV